MSRGNQGQSIFKDDQDRERYLDLLQESQKRFAYRLYAYVLMGNHVHHLIQIDQTPAIEGDAKHFVSLHGLLRGRTRHSAGRPK